MPESIQQWDFSVLNAIQLYLRTPFLDRVIPFISGLANFGFIWIAIAAAMLFFKEYQRGGITVMAALLIDLVGCDYILKNIFRRPRPCDIAPVAQMLVSRPSGFSLPSGHTCVSFAAATVIFSVNKKWGVGAYVLASLIGLTRLYLYVHFPTDVLAGAFFGVLFGIAAIRLVALAVHMRERYAS